MFEIGALYLVKESKYGMVIHRELSKSGDTFLCLSFESVSYQCEGHVLLTILSNNKKIQINYHPKSVVGRLLKEEVEKLIIEQ